MTNDKFKRNLSGKSTYECQSCGKNTRETGLGEQGCSLCAYCFEVGGLENELSDGNITEEEYNAQLAAFNRKYKRQPVKEDPKPTALDQAKVLRNAARKALRHAKAEGADEETVKVLRTASNAARRSYLQARKASK